MAQPPDVTQPQHPSRSLPLILARELASNLSTPMFLVDAEGMLVYCNDAAELLIGRSMAEMGEISGNDFAQLIDLRYPDDTPMSGHESPAGIAFYKRRPAHRRALWTALNGEAREVNATSYPLVGAQEELHGVVTVFWPLSDTNGDA